MTVAEFLQHHSLTENPFRGEEARSDAVFARMQSHSPLNPVAGEGATPTPNASSNGSLLAATFHSDFEKILGDLRQPSSAVVFGEKGSGKTAIRLQIAERVAEFNVVNAGNKVVLIAYDDLNSVLERLNQAAAGKTPLESLQKTRLVDHMDAMLRMIVPRVVDSVLTVAPENERLDLGPDIKRAIRRLDPVQRRDLLLLQALYDREEHAPLRTRFLRRRLRIPLPASVLIGNLATMLLPLLLVAVAVYQQFFAPPSMREPWARWAVAGAAGMYLLFLLKFLVWNRLANLHLARRLRRQLRALGRTDLALARSLRQLDPSSRDSRLLPLTDSDEPRYIAFERLRRILLPFGYSALLVIIDRVDEPSLVNGDPDRMRAFVWPLLNNKFLQQPAVGVKLLLPIELRHALFKESSAFFQEARLDKQSMIERLSWTGAMLYDLSESRMAACKFPGAPAGRLTDLFDDDVTREDVINALDQMHQPRDAFKLLYRCLAEHCATVTREQNRWNIPRLILETVKKQEIDRVQQLYRGIRPG